MDEYYQKCIEQAFIDPIRSVVIVDDDYPTAMEVLDARIGENAGQTVANNKTWLTNPQPVKDVISEFRDGSRPFILDIHDAQTMTEDDEIKGAAHLHQTDLLVLDYELDRDKEGDYSRSLRIARGLMLNAHFNLIIVNTNNDLDTVFRNFLLGLLSPTCRPLSEDDEKQVEEAYSQKDDSDNFDKKYSEAFGFSQYVMVWQDAKSAMKNLMKGTGAFAQAKTLFESVNLDRKYWKIMARNALLTYEAKCVAEELMSEENLNVGSFSNENGAKWIRSDRAFITFSHKPDGTNLLDCLQAALEDWNPKPSRLVLTKMLAEIDEHGVEMQGEALQDNFSSALWYEGILNADDNQRKSKVDETVQRHVDGMVARLLPEVQKFTNELATHEDDNKTTNVELVKAHYGVDLENSDMKQIAVLAHNAMVCAQEKHGWHIQTGHIFELAGSMWVCVSPSCDTVPSQIPAAHRELQGNRLRINALKLHEKRRGRLPDRIQSNRYVFLKSDDDTRVFSITESTDSMPEVGVFFADNEGIFSEDMKLKLRRTEEPADSTELIMQEHDVQIIGHLRYEYALNLIHKLGAALTRVGLDFAGT